MKKQLYLWVRVVMAVALVATLVLAGCAAPAQPAPSPTSDKAPQEGIQVHGHWTLEVRNPDGSLAERREFDNAIVPGATGGSYLLVAFLGRQSSIGGWYIALSALQTFDSPFDDGNLFQGE